MVLTDQLCSDFALSAKSEHNNKYRSAEDAAPAQAVLSIHYRVS
jgi:hypothetical protein